MRPKIRSALWASVKGRSESGGDEDARVRIRGAAWTPEGVVGRE